MAIINLQRTDMSGLIEGIVISVATSFRKNVKRWKRHIKENDIDKAELDVIHIWEDLAWFIGGDIEELYPCNEVDGYKIYAGLYEEWENAQAEMHKYVDKPAWLESMEESYNESK